MGRGRTPGPLRKKGSHTKKPDLLAGVEHKALDDFKRAVLDAQVAHLIRKGRHFFAAVPSSELEVIEDKHEMRRPAAARCRELLRAAREQLAAAKQNGEPRAQKTESVVIHSAYRSIATDKLAWESTFRQHYRKALELRLFADDPLGPRAQQHMVDKLIKFKAPPGYSNHSNGAAVDFGTTYDGEYYKANTSMRSEWRKTWLHPWLKENAATFGFKPLATEEWHWDFKGP